MKTLTVLSAILSLVFLSACSGSLSVGELDVGGKKVLENYSTSFGDQPGEKVEDPSVDALTDVSEEAQ